MKARSPHAERLIPGLIIAGIAVCAITVFAVRPQPLPPAAQARWAQIAAAQVAGQPVNGRTFVIDGVIAEGRDHPGAGEIVVSTRAAMLRVHGWAFDPTSLRAASGVAYRVDRGAWQSAGYHIARPDVSSFFGYQDAVNSGFDAHISTAGWPSGRHEVELSTVGPAGSHTPFGVQIRVALRAR